MITPTTVSDNKVVQDTTSTNLVINRMDQDYALRSSCEVFLEYNMNEYGETPTESVTIANYDLDTEATITGAVANGSTITYTANNSFVAGDIVTIIGVTPSVFNLKEVTVASRTSTTFTINNTSTGTRSEEHTS